MPREMPDCGEVFDGAFTGPHLVEFENPLEI